MSLPPPSTTPSPPTPKTKTTSSLQMSSTPRTSSLARPRRSRPRTKSLLQKGSRFSKQRAVRAHLRSPPQARNRANQIQSAQHRTEPQNGSPRRVPSMIPLWPPPTLSALTATARLSMRSRKPPGIKKPKSGPLKVSHPNLKV